MDPVEIEQSEESEVITRRHASCPSNIIYNDEISTQIYTDEIALIENNLKAIGIRVEHISSSDKIQNVFDLARQSFDPFSKKIDEQDLFPEIPEAGETDEETRIAMKSVQGDTLGDCIVTLKEKYIKINNRKLKVPGNPEFQTFYNGKLFRFNTAEDLKKFTLHPELYLPNTEPIVTEYKILIVGPKNCGKSTICTKLSEEFGIPYIDLSEIPVPELPKKEPKIITNEEGDEDIEEEETIEDTEEMRNQRLSDSIVII